MLEPQSLGSVRRVRDAFLAAGYTGPGVLEALGPQAQAALGRDETVPARRATRDGSPLATLIRLFLLQLPVPESAAGRALPLADALRLGLLTRAGDEVRAAVDVRPYAPDDAPHDAPWWIVADLGTGLDGTSRPLPDDHVLGVGGASVTLAQLTPRPPVGAALDVGTGSGVQALHLSRHAAAVTATDVLPRALRLAAYTAAFCDVDLDLRQGSLYEPVRGERFDAVVSNPPFVVSPAGRHAYRDSGLPGDEVCRRLVAQAPEILTEGGWLVLLANWVHRRGEPWEERVASWLPAGVDATVVQRETQDPAAYVATWLRDSGEPGSPAYLEQYDTWLDALEHDGVEAVGFGWLLVRRHAGTRGDVRDVLDWPYAVEQPLGGYLLEGLDAQVWAANADDAELLQARLRVAADVVQEQYGRPGAEDPEHLVLRRGRGLRRVFRTGTETAAVAGACDGRLPLGVIVDAVAEVLGEDRTAVWERVVPQVLELVRTGILEASGNVIEPRRVRGATG